MQCRQTYGKPLIVVRWCCAEQRLQAKVCWQGEAGSVDKELSTNVEEDEEEVESAETEDHVDFGNARLLLEVLVLLLDDHCSGLGLADNTAGDDLHRAEAKAKSEKSG